MSITPHTDKRPGTSRQEDHQAAPGSDTQQGVLTVKHLTRPTLHNHALADLLLELLGDEAESIICQRTPKGRGTVHRRLTGDSDWTMRELIYLADMIGVTPTRLLSAISQVAVHGADLGQTATSLALAAQAGEK